MLKLCALWIISDEWALSDVFRCDDDALARHISKLTDKSKQDIQIRL
jgi:hypothetical protein